MMSWEMLPIVIGLLSIHHCMFVIMDTRLNPVVRLVKNACEMTTTMLPICSSDILSVVEQSLNKAGNIPLRSA